MKVPKTRTKGFVMRKIEEAFKGKRMPYVILLSLLLLLTAGLYPMRAWLGLANLALFYSIPVLFAAIRWGTKSAVVTALVGILLYDLFFVPPQFTLAVFDLRYNLTFLFILFFGIFTGRLADQVKKELGISKKREERLTALYTLSQRFTASRDRSSIIETLLATLSPLFNSEFLFFSPPEEGELAELTQFSSQAVPLDQRERAVATWVYHHGQKAGRGTETLFGVKGTYLPLKDQKETYGVIGVWGRGDPATLTDEQEQLLEAALHLTTLAIARTILIEQAQEVALLRRSEELRSALFNSLSHDLRTPLATILGSVSTLLEGKDRFDKETVKGLLLQIEEGAERLSRYITNLLDMAKLESGNLPIKREPNDIQEMIGVVLSRFKNPPRERIEIGLDEGLPLVHVDGLMIEQVLTNLLDNALKYTVEGEKIGIEARQVGEEVVIAVENPGHIPKKDLPHLFQRFYRIEQRRQVKGTGLGLAICKGFVEAHGGRIWAENLPGGRLSFYFTLPVYQGSPNECRKR